MAFTFTDTQIDEILALMEQATIEGNYSAAYQRVADILSTPLPDETLPTDDPAIDQVYRWFRKEVSESNCF